MEHSILTSTKKILGIDPSYTAFDVDIITHINSTFSTLNQLGLGPEDGFWIEDAEPVWTDFEPDPIWLNHIRTYVFLKVRLIFDPPNTSFVLAALERQVTELEFRLSLEREDVEWVDPAPAPEPLPSIIDGGDE
ncbi:MAG TPA: hypothetical protein PKD12_08260 [Nitrospira sp.]|nr:hypothetical protein [Nitrospira sp.]